MKKSLILFYSFFSLIAYSQNNIVPVSPPPVQTLGITASDLKVSVNYPMINYQFNFSGDFFRVETTLYKNSVSSSNRVAFGIQEDESEYAATHYPVGYLYKDFMNNQDHSAYT